MIAALKPELDALADRLAIPRLRGFKSSSGNKTMANQGDGVMALNPAYFNAWATRVGGRSPTGAVEALQAQREALQAQMLPLRDRLREIQKQLEGVSLNDPLWAQLWDEKQPLLLQMGKLREADDKIWRKIQVIDRKSSTVEPSKWTPGDDAKKRPFTAELYFADGVDRARTVLFHEFGHHVHQYLKRQGPRRQFGKPPLERDLATYYRRELYADPNRILSKYATTNEYEWFAESFAAYVMGRRDLLGPAAIELMESLFNGTY